MKDGKDRTEIGSSIEFREIVREEDKDGKPLPVLQGYGARFNTRSLSLGMMGLGEEIDPQAFDESLAKNPDILLRFNHNPNNGRSRHAAMLARR